MSIRRIALGVVTAAAAGGLSFGLVSATAVHKPAHIYEASHIYEAKAPAHIYEAAVIAKAPAVSWGGG